MRVTIGFRGVEAEFDVGGGTVEELRVGAARFFGVGPAERDRLRLHAAGDAPQLLDHTARVADALTEGSTLTLTFPL